MLSPNTPFSLGTSNTTTRPPFSMFPEDQMLDGGGEINPLSLEARADKITYALGEISPSRQRLIDNLRLNGEGMLRDMATAREEQLRFQDNVEDVTEAAANGDSAAVAAVINNPSPPVDPNVSMETLWARMFINDYFFADGEFPDYEMLSPQEQIQYDVMVRGLEANLIRDEVIQRKFEQYSDQWAEENFVNQAFDVIEGMIPVYTWAFFAQQLEAIPAWNDLHLSGDSLRAQIDQLYLLPPAEFERVVSATVDSMAEENMNLTFYFLSALRSFTRSDQVMMNLFDAIDLAAPPGITAIARTGFRALRASRAARNTPTIQTTGTRPAGIGVDGTPTAAGTVGQLQPTIWSTSATMRRQALRDVREAAEATIENLNAARVANISGEGTDTIFTVVRDPQWAARNEVFTAGQAEAGRVVVTSEELMRRIAVRMPAYANPTQVASGNRFFNHTRDAIARIETSFSRLDPTGSPMVTSTYHIARMTREDYGVAVNAAEARLRNELGRGGHNSIYSIERIEAEDLSHNVDLIAARLAKPSGDLFVTRSEATQWARDVIGLDKGSFTVIREGRDWAIEVVKPVDETGGGVLDLAITANNATRQPWFGLFRSFRDILGESMNRARKSYEHRQQYNNQYYESIRKDMNVSGEARKQLEEFYVWLRDTGNFPGVDPNTVVRTLTSQHDFDTAWHSRFGTFPSKKISRAYWAYIQLHQLRWGIENMGMYKHLERLGMMSVKIQTGRGGVDVSFTGRVLDDVDLDTLPGNAAILFYSNTARSAGGSFSQVRRVDTLTTAEKSAIRAGLDNSDVQMILVHNRLSLPFSPMGKNEVVDYVLTGDFTTKRLPPEQIPWVPGGQVINNEPIQLRQLRTGTIGSLQRRVRFSEAVLSGARSEKIGNQMAKDFNEALRLYRTATTGAGPHNFNPLIVHLSNKLPHVDAMEFIDALRTRKLSPDDTVFVTKRGSTIVDTYGSKNAEIDDIIKGTTADEDVPMGSPPVGTQERPMWDLQMPEILSPRAAIDRQMSNASRLTHLADYVTKAAYQFVKEFESVLDVRRADLRANPVKHLLNPTWRKGAELQLHGNILRRAKNFHRSVRDMLMNQGPLRRNLNVIEDKIFESIHGFTMGQKEIGGKSIARWVSDVVPWFLDDAPARLRSFAFHLKMGLFNWTQLIKQGQTVFVSSAITGNPIRAWKAMEASIMMLPLIQLGKNANLVDHVGNLISKLGWKKADFLELWKLADESGITIIRGEHTFKDGVLDPSLRTSKVGNRIGRFIDWASIFFKNGETISRLQGFNIAYLEWRAKNPTKGMRRVDAEGILLRAGTLNVNMTHSANATWQRGWTAFPTQFFSYQIRLAELFWGKQLTVPEKARLLLIQSALYGLPIGGFGTAFGLFGPMHDNVQKMLLENGVNLDNAGVQLLINGAFGAITQMITGEPTTAAQDYGPAGLDLFINTLAGDETFREIVLGVSFQTLADIFEDAYPFLKAIKGMFGFGPSVPIAWEDYAQLLRNSSGFSQAERTFMAINAQTYYRSKDDRVMMTGLNSGQITLEAIFGIEPAYVNEAFLLDQMQRDHIQDQIHPRQEIIEAVRRYAEVALRTGISDIDRQRLMEGIQREITQWMILGGFTPQQRSEITAEALRILPPEAYAAHERYAINNDLPNPEQRLDQFVNDPQTRIQRGLPGIDAPPTPEMQQTIQNIENVGR